MSDLIDRQAAIDAVCMEWCGVKHQDCKHPFDVEKGDYYWCDGCETVLRTLPDFPSAQQDCTECPDYDHETHSCPKYCEVIRQTLEETQPEIDEILDYLDTELHPLVSPEHWDVYATLYDMISLLHLKQPQQTGRCKDCLMRDVCSFEQFLGLNGFCSQWQKMEENNEAD